MPEVVQTSAMDCGPAAVKALLGGFGIEVSYGRLREACQTHLDGTSIDTLEVVAQRLGLEADQIMVPVDHLLLPEARCLPAIVVVQQPAGDTHFVVVWRRHGGIVQVMDPATGRRWPSVKKLLEEVYVHDFPVSAAAWREYAGSEGFLAPLRARLARLGAEGSRIDETIRAALDAPGWRALSALDATVRAVGAMTRAGAVRRGAEATRAVGRLAERAAGDGGFAAIPQAYWSARPEAERHATTGAESCEEGPAATADEGETEDPAEQLILRGAVLLRVRDRRAADVASLDVPELLAAVEERPARPALDLLRLVRADGLLVPGVLLGALAATGAGVVLEAVLLRGLFHLGAELGLVGQRLVAMAALVALSGALLFVEVSAATALFRLGRRLELRLRMAFLEKVSRLGDRYFGSRPVSDMAERSHSVHRVRAFPELGGQLARAVFEALFTTLGIVWLAPSLTPIALLAALVAIGLPLAAQPVLVEQDLRVRTHAGGLVRFYLDALLGLVAVRTHGAEPAVRREHEGLLVEWARASLGLVHRVALFEGLHSALGFGLAAALLIGYVAGGGEPAGVLLLVYWALNLPALGQEIAAVAWQYPSLRNVTLRLLELLGAVDEGEGIRERDGDAQSVARPEPAGSPQAAPHGVAIEMQDVLIRAAGHEILREVTLQIAPGSHVAIVGPSGAGKSSLVGVLLGWHRPASGSVRIDGELLDDARLARLRKETAWTDPAVQLWNRSLLDNLCYGAQPSPPRGLGEVVEAADLRGILQRLPDGMLTGLGEGGALVSGGEGQRVRLGRAMLRPEAGLVILDEPFRGLDRAKRSALLDRARAWWPRATLLCITHDVGETLGFARVLVIERGRIVEDGVPAELAAREGSRYCALLDAEEEVRRGMWASGAWRHIELSGGRLLERAADGTERP